MEFSKLRLVGFKSFVDPVELDILSGLTGIVGPNGCGKSNLLEALRWAMGENRPSSMRGSAMDDVIFAGAGARPAKTFAEVLISLENVHQNSGTEGDQKGSVEVVRRVTRDIGSSYRLNGKDVRAKDISMLFADSSTGSHSPSLVRQGQIAELINANPHSRRRLLEEAAGISGLYQRRHEAELKLKSSDNNMTRLQDVIEQLDNQIKILEKQAKQASKYTDLAEEIRINEGFLFCKKWFEFETNLLAQNNVLVEKNKLSAEVELEVISLSNHRERLQEELPGLRNEEITAASALQRLVVEKESIEKEQERAKSIILELKMRADETNMDYDRQHNLISDAMEVVERVKWESTQLKTLSDGEDALIKQAQQEAAVTAKKLVDDEVKLDNDSGEFAKLSAKFQNIERQIGKAEDDLEQTVRDIEKSESNRFYLKDELKNKQLELVKTKSLLKKCEEEAIIAENSLETIEKLRVEAIAEESKKRVVFSALEGKLAALKSELDALRGLIGPTAGKSHQILDDVRIVEGYEMALGAAFSDDIKAPIIFSNDKSGWFLLPELKENNELPAGAVSITNKVTAPETMKRRLSNVGLVDSADGPRLQEFLTPGQKLVSKNGSLWRWDGYCQIEGDNLSETAVRLKQKNRLTDLLAEIEATEDDVESVRINLRRAQEDSAKSEQAGASARVKRSKSDEQLSDASKVVSKVDYELSMLNSKLDGEYENSLARKKYKESLEMEILELRKVLQSLGDLGLQKHLLEEQHSVVEQSRKLMVEKRARYDQVSRDADIRSKRLEELALDSKNWERRLTLANESKVELEKRLVTIKKELSDARKQPQNLLDRKERLIDLITEAGIKKSECSENLSKQESALRVCISEERELLKKASSVKEDIARANAITENVELNLAELRKSLKEDTSSDPEDVLKSLRPQSEQLPDISTIERKLISLKNSRDTLGAVNLRAAEDSKELIEEARKLAEEKTDLETAIKKLRSAIVTLNSEGRSRLLSAFQLVNKNFGELFESLFGGGSAKLSFIESEDPLDAGLEIICQPPGKKLTTLSLLSGGEQTLTALALIFAVFKANPSPICVLDEVDAPLDDANVERYCGLLDEMAMTTQTRFMIITHHPLTMSRMDRLYGVTMVERGVSQLVSVDLNKAEQLLDL